MLMLMNRRFPGLLEQQQQWRFLWEDGAVWTFHKFALLCQLNLWPEMDLPNSRISVNFDARAAEDFARLVMPPPAINQFTTNEISKWLTSYSVYIFLALMVITVSKLDFVHPAQNSAHKLSLASQRADSHGHILSKSTTNLANEGECKKGQHITHRGIICHLHNLSLSYSNASSL